MTSSPSGSGSQLPQAAYIDGGRQEGSEEAPKFLVVDQTHKEVAHHGFNNAPQLVKSDEDREQEEAQRHATVCGLRRRWFWTVLAIAIIVIGAAVGGGVGGSIAASRKGSNGETGPAESLSSILVSNISLTLATHVRRPSATSSSNAADTSTTATPAVEAEDFAFQGFEEPRYEGRATDMLRGTGAVEISCSGNESEDKSRAICVTRNM